MIVEELLRLISQGENSAVEFKESALRPEALAREMVAFANAAGGTILIGVSDDANILGLRGERSWEEWVLNIARTSVVPALAPQVEFVLVDELEVCVVTVPKGSSKPYQTSDHRFLVRVGSTNRNPTQHELMRLFQQSGVFHYDAVPITGSRISDLNLARIDAFFSRFEIDFLSETETDREILLRNSDIIAENGELTVAGALLFGIAPQRYLRNASISVARFRGNEIDEDLADLQVVEGTLDVQIDQALSIIKNNVPIASHIEGAKRVDTTAHYPDKIFRELLVNACAHRNYAISGSRIRVLMFDDRIEFCSPGRLPNAVSIEKLSVGVSFAVNPIIVKFLENMRYIDKLGRGLPMVFREAKKLGVVARFSEFGEEFHVTLPTPKQTTL